MESAKNTLFKTSIVATLMVLGATACATPPSSGQLVIINGLDNLTAANANTNSRSNIMVQVYDTHTPTSPCYTAQRLGYYNVAIIKWQANGVHNATSCAGTGIGTAAISKVVITPLNKLINNRITIIYDATVDTSVPKATADAIDFTPPTTTYTNMTLLINGSGIPSTVGQTASSTNWGFTVTPTAPVFDVSTGALSATGVPGAVGAYGVRAEKLMRHYGIIPFHTAANNDELF
ncbi:MAG: hypothetical protein P4L79_09085 [Legionella sp.]|uniref:hypothetical protein n=1 Tax=Legionella sp. TaxID=459 RepID=UPI00284B0B40|nr:hypothetical protein [Legionella sp.]